MTLDPNTVADLLARQGLVSPENAELIRKEARQLPAHRHSARAYEQQAVAYELIQTLHLPNARDGGVIGEYEIARAIAADAGLEFVRIDSLSLDADLIESKISRPFAKRHRMLPLQMVEGRLRVACANPYDIEAIDSFRRIAGREPELVVASEPDILRALTEFYGLRHAVKRAERDLSAGIDLGNLEQLVRMKSESEIESSDQHIVNAVEFMLQHAYDTRASDIHLEPKRDVSLARFRIDGVLHNTLSPPKRYQSAIISRVKIMSNMNIAEKRLPQDGRIKIKMPDREIDLRVSTIPIVHGERVVMRLLDRGAMFYGLEEMGFSPDKLERFSRLIALPYGIILVTGPTGSGKSTTLYGALSRINTEDRNILTIEDPVEYQIPGIGQIHVKPKINLTFASGLRHILRQDPDVIMVGEIRDLETAEIAIQASLTGHLVFSTLHTNDAAGAITRLIDMGVEPFLVSSSVIAIMAQRLVRVICPKCRERYVPPPETLRALGLSPADLPDGTVSRGKGCDHCMGTGYRGRSGIFELLVIDDEIRQLVLDRISSNVIKKTALGKGMLTLRGDGAQKVAKGITTIEEVLRITQEEVFEV